MDSTTIELKVTYGKDLKVSNYFQKPVVYVQVSIGSYYPDEELEENLQQVQRTATVREEDGHPEWNQEMRFELTDAMVVDPAHFFLQFDLKHEGRVFGEKPIGDARVPFLDLFGGSDGIVRYVSYEVRMVDGRPNGSLNFSYRVNFKGGDLGMGMNLQPAGGNITGYPVGDYDHFPGPDPVQAYPAQVQAYPAAPDPVQVYPPPSVNVVAYPIGHEVGNLSSDLNSVQVYPPPIAHEVGRLSPDPVQMYPPLSVNVVAYPTGQPLSSPYPRPLNGCFPSPPEAVAINHHHHHHHVPSPTPIDYHHHHHHVPSPTPVSNPHEYPSGYEHSPGEWTTGIRPSSPWARR